MPANREVGSERARVLPLHLATLQLPEGHPEGEGPCEVYAFLVLEGRRAFLVDTGVGTGSTLIDRLYRPERRPLGEALAAHGVAAGDIELVIASHLHFDHCGGLRELPGVPVLVQRRELEASETPHYTVPDWVRFPGAQHRAIEGAYDVSPCVRVLPSPGHTPGHQSVLVDTDEGRFLVAAQAFYSAAELEAARAGEPGGAQGHDDDDAYARSRAALLALRTDRVAFSHDAAVWSSPAFDHWRRFAAREPDAARRGYVDTFAFGTTEEEATEIAPLVRAGTKTATGSLLWSYEYDGAHVPAVGDLWVVRDGAGEPVCIVETTAVETLPFDSVPAAYAEWGGEGDRSVEGWRRMYWDYVVSECARIGREPRRDAPLVMERFRVVD